MLWLTAIAFQFVGFAAQATEQSEPLVDVGAANNATASASGSSSDATNASAQGITSNIAPSGVANAASKDASPTDGTVKASSPKGEPLSLPTASSKSEPEIPCVSEPHQYPFAIGLRAIMMPGAAIGGFGVGFDAGYSVLPNLAIGVTATRFFVDQGADPQYCERCVRTGSTALLFAEGRLWPEKLLTPYARLGMGHTRLEGQVISPFNHVEDRLAVSAELGAEFHYKIASVRGFGFHYQPLGSPLDDTLLMGFGLQLGVRL